MEDVSNGSVRVHGNTIVCTRGYFSSTIFTDRPGVREAKSTKATIPISMATFLSRRNTADICCEATASPN